jgi:hypothetical protein
VPQVTSASLRNAKRIDTVATIAAYLFDVSMSAKGSGGTSSECSVRRLPAGLLPEAKALLGERAPDKLSRNGSSLVSKRATANKTPGASTNTNTMPIPTSIKGG